jgi:simple sugar transport system permease protein
VIKIPYQITSTLPYVLTIIVVAGAMGRAIAPAAVGRPYKKN